MRSALLLIAMTGTLACCDRIPGTAEFKLAEHRRVAADQIKAAEAVASHDLLDPMSVQFRSVVIRRRHAEDSTFGHSPVVCGELNAKNALGAYVGFRRFVSGFDKANVEIETQQMPPPGARDAAWQRCLDDTRTMDDPAQGAGCVEFNTLNRQSTEAAMFSSTWALDCVD